MPTHINPVRPTAVHSSAEGDSCAGLTVLYDGSCPLCRREISVYQSLTPLQAVSWQDVSGDACGLSAEDQQQLMSRFHVRREDGELLSGAAAFVALWLAMPGWRWLGRMARFPGVTPILELAYRGFLRVRPRLQGWALFLEKRSQ